MHLLILLRRSLCVFPVASPEIETVLKANKQDAAKFIAEVDADGDGCVVSGGGTS
jgi:hypothetical protein